MKRVDWKREDLERVQASSGEADTLALAEEIGVARGTIYSIRSRIKHEGIDEILRKQSHRNEQYRLGGGASGARETLADQLSKTYAITVGAAGRGGSYPQHSLTIPSRLGAAWVGKWGRFVRFVPQEDGLLIVPSTAPEPPSWLPPEGDVAADNGATSG